MPKNPVPTPKAENSIPKQPGNNTEKNEVVKIVPEAQKKADNLPGKKSEVIKPKAEADLTLAQMLPFNQSPTRRATKSCQRKLPGKERYQSQSKRIPQGSSGKGKAQGRARR